MTSVLTSARSSQRRSISSLSASSASLSHTISSIDSSKPAIIIELGTKLTKCGFAGEYVPRIVRTQFLDEKLRKQEGFLEKEGGPTIKSLLFFFKSIFHNTLVTMPRERRVIIVENLLCPTQVRLDICKVLLEILHVPSVMFIPSHLSATFPFNTDNALVVDVGSRETLALPIGQGVTMLNNHEISPVGASCLEDRVRVLMREHGRVESTDGEQHSLTDEDWKYIDEHNILEDITCRYVFCTSLTRALRIQSEGVIVEQDPAAAPARIPFATKMLIVPGLVREAACEVFFEEKLGAEASISQLIHKIVSKCPLDLRKTMFGRIMMIGGATLIPGFMARLKEELAAEGLRRGTKAAESIRFLRFDGQKVELYAAWLGGSMFGSLQDAVQLRSITRDQFLEKGTIPDWTDYVQYNIPNGRRAIGAA